MCVSFCNPSTWKTETTGSEVQGHSQVHNESKVSLDYRNPYFLNNNNNKIFWTKNKQNKNLLYFSVLKKKRRLLCENIVYLVTQTFVFYFYKIADKIWFFTVVQNMWYWNIYYSTWVINTQQMHYHLTATKFSIYLGSRQEINIAFGLNI